MCSKAIHNAKRNKMDYYLTPEPVARLMIEMAEIKDTDLVLDPSKGKGVFFDNLPYGGDYCEITEGKDFFDNRNYYDVIIGNPPYSIWDRWISHTVKICDKFCYLFGQSSLTHNRIKMIHDAGFGATKICILKVNWWMTQSMIVVFEKGKPSILTSSPIQKCECGKTCGRGVYGNDPNKCNKSNTKTIKQQKEEYYIE